jgi:hypothetical protein
VHVYSAAEYTSMLKAGVWVEIHTEESLANGEDQLSSSRQRSRSRVADQCSNAWPGQQLRFSPLNPNRRNFITELEWETINDVVEIERCRDQYHN